MSDEQPGADALRFNELWESYAGRVLVYASRHVGPDDAQEVVSETFLVAWRRLADVPGHPLPWLLVVARNTVANHRRSHYRGAVLEGELRRLQETAGPGAGADVTATDRACALTQLAALTAQDREALLLVSWDGLTPADAARVAGCSVAAFHVRLHRARRKLRPRADPEAVDDPAPAPSLTPARTRPLDSSRFEPRLHPTPRTSPITSRTTP